MSGTGSSVGGAAGGDGAVNQLPTRQMHGSKTPPRFEGAFELYQTELELYLGEQEVWDVVVGTETRHASDQTLQTEFENKDRFARATLLRGLRGCQNDDATKVCSKATAAEMWASLVSDKTQCDFSYAVMLRRQASHSRGKSMADYLKKMSRLHQQQQSMGTEHIKSLSASVGSTP